MIKLLNFADLHYCPEREKKCFQILDWITDQARQFKPDYITISGDLQDKLLINSYNYGLPKLKNKLVNLSTIAPIIMIYGTSSHDAPGSLEVFQTNKIAICRPGTLICDKKKKIVFFAIPEASKDIVISNNNITTVDNAGRDLNNKLERLCLSYAAYRKQHQDYAAVVLGHGIIKCNKTQHEKAVEKATVYLTESDLAVIGADLYLWGHLHTPYNFETITGGYCGSFSYTWKDLDYKPRIIKSYIPGNEKANYYVSVDITFIPERIKVSNLEQKDYPLRGWQPDFKDKMIWYETEKDHKTTVGDLLKLGGTPGSKVTVKPTVEKIIRSTEIIKAKTYREMFLLYKPSATEQELLLCDELYNYDIQNGNIQQEKKVITLVSTHIRGAKPFLEGIGKEEIFIDWTKYNQGLIGIIGPGGMGKTYLLDCITPFTELFTQQNSLLSTFELSDSFIINKFRVNDDIITLKILIKAGDKKPTVEYYAYVNDVPVEDCKKNLEPFNRFIYKTFGTPRMFAVSVFKTQHENPKLWQGKLLNPSLVNADNSMLKTIVNEFSGVDKSSAYFHAVDRYNTICKKINDLEIEIKTKMSFIDEYNIKCLQEDIRALNSLIFSYSKRKQTFCDEIKIKKAELNNKLTDLKYKLSQEKEKELSNKNLKASHDVLLKNYNKELAVYQNEIYKYNKKKSELKIIIAKLDNSITNSIAEINNNNNMIHVLNSPCPNCGYVKDNEKIISMQKKIKELQILRSNEIQEKANKLLEYESLKFDLKKPEYPKDPVYKKIDSTIQEKIYTINNQLTKLDFNNDVIKIDNKITQLQADIKSKEEIICKVVNYQNKIKILEDKILSLNKENWFAMTRAWHRDGIPAMLLEHIAPEIDLKVNRLLDEHYPGLMIKTSTLRKHSNGKDMIEDFHIDIINTITGRTKPINCLSGEQREFVIPIIYKVFRRINERNTGIIYNFSLSDEPDAYISEDLMPEFWDMKKDLLAGIGRLDICVSHKPGAKERFGQIIDIREV